MTRFENLPPEVASPECRNALFVLQAAPASASSFLDIFDAQRAQRKARGVPTDSEQDLLRAMLLFASAGLDSMVKHLVRDALPRVIERSLGARKQLTEFIARIVRRKDPLDVESICELLLSDSPSNAATLRLINELTASSLQSAEQLLRVAAFFDIPSREISANRRELQEVFDRRNEMAHEMDIDFTPSNRNRRQRRKEAMIDDTNRILQVAAAFLAQVDSKLA